MIVPKKKRTRKPKEETKKEETMPKNQTQNNDDLAFEMDENAVAKLEKQLESKNAIFKFPNGDTVMLLLPPKRSYGVPNNLPFAVTSVHYLGDLEKGLGVTFPEDLSKMQACALAHGEKKCAWCEWMNDLKASTNRAHKKLGGQLYPNTQAFANIVNITSSDKSRWDVALARMSKTIVEPLLSQIKYGAALHDPKALMQILVKRTEKGSKIEYNVQVLQRKSIPFQSIWSELMKNPMEKIHSPMPYDEVKQWIEDLTSGSNNYTADYSDY